MKLTLDNIKIHVCEPQESSYKDMWYKDPTTFSYCHCFDEPAMLSIGSIIEDDMGARFKILSIHWKWEKIGTNEHKPILEFTVERYIRRGKQNPFML